MMNKHAVGIKYIEARPADVPRLWVDATKFYERTGFQAKYSFEQGLEETIAYYTELAERKNLLSDIIVKNWEAA